MDIMFAKAIINVEEILRNAYFWNCRTDYYSVPTGSVRCQYTIEDVSIPCHFVHHGIYLVCYCHMIFKHLRRPADPHKQCAPQALRRRPGWRGSHYDLEQYMSCLNMFVYWSCKVRISGARRWWKASIWGASILWGRYYFVTSDK